METITQEYDTIVQPYEIVLPPTEDELPYDDGMPMESDRHVLQMYLLRDGLAVHWQHRQDFHIGCNMFVYYRLDQVDKLNFRGPDVFVALNVPRRERKSWVVWQEGKGPDVVIELLSHSTASFDKQQKKRIYQDHLRVPEYYWYEPFTGELAGFALRGGMYEALKPTEQGLLISEQTGLALVRWYGTYFDVEARWLRWATLDGRVLPTQAEVSAQERQRADEERQRADEERQRADEERQRADETERRADEERRRTERLIEQLRKLGQEPDI